MNTLESYRRARDFAGINCFQTEAWDGALLWIVLDFALPNPAAGDLSPEKPEKRGLGLAGYSLGRAGADR